MHYTGEVYRPPLEAYTPLLEVTYGCSHNRCSFCSMYRNTPFGISPVEDVESDILELKNLESRSPHPIERIYLVNGDPFVLSTERLLAIAELIHKHLQHVKVISGYLSLQNILHKSEEEWQQLKDAGFDEFWIGIESGYEPALLQMNKGVDREESFAALERLKKVGLSYYAILMMGVAGRGNGEKNARATAALINSYPPIMVAIMSTVVQAGTPLAEMEAAGEFIQATEGEMLKEQIILLENLDLPGEVYYNSQHMVNLIPIHDRMENKDRIIQRIQYTLDHASSEKLNAIIDREAR